MIKIENDCVGCPQGCINCGRKRVPHWYCDRCDAEVDEGELWKVDGEQICEECLKDMYEKVTCDDADNYDDAYDMADYYYDRMKDKDYDGGD